MFMYKDFNYIKYIMNLSFDKGYLLYKNCINRFTQKQEERTEDKYFTLFLFDVEHNNFKGSFKDYYKEMKSKTDNLNLSYEERLKEEQDLINKYDNLNDSNFKFRKVM